MWNIFWVLPVEPTKGEDSHPNGQNMGFSEQISFLFPFQSYSNRGMRQNSEWLAALPEIGWCDGNENRDSFRASYSPFSLLPHVPPAAGSCLKSVLNLFQRLHPPQHLWQARAHAGTKATMVFVAVAVVLMLNKSPGSNPPPHWITFRNQCCRCWLKPRC